MFALFACGVRLITPRSRIQPQLGLNLPPDLIIPSTPASFPVYILAQWQTILVK